MRILRAALAVETRKTAAARVTIATTIFLALGVGCIAAGMTLAARSGNAQVMTKLGPAATLRGWEDRRFRRSSSTWSRPLSDPTRPAIRSGGWPSEES